MYFELKAYSKDGVNRLQLDVNPPLLNNGNSIEAETVFDARLLRILLRHVSDQLIPRIVAKHYITTNPSKKGIPQSIADLDKFYDDFKNKYGKQADLNEDQYKTHAAEAKKLVEKIASFIDNTNIEPIPTTRFQFENVQIKSTQDIRSAVNGDIPPPPRPGKP